MKYVIDPEANNGSGAFVGDKGPAEFLNHVCKLRQLDKESFHKVIVVEQLETPLRVYRISDKTGSYWTTEPPTNWMMDAAANARALTFCTETNFYPANIEDPNVFIMVYTIPAGTMICRGAIAPQEPSHLFHGGNEQVCIEPPDDRCITKYKSLEAFKNNEEPHSTNTASHLPGMVNEDFDISSVVNIWSESHRQSVFDPQKSILDLEGGVDLRESLPGSCVVPIDQPRSPEPASSMPEPEEPTAHFLEETDIFQQTLAVAGLSACHNEQQNNPDSTQTVYSAAPQDPGGIVMHLGEIAHLNMDVAFHQIILNAFHSGLISQKEIEQILRELTIGIYLYGEAPWLSIEGNHFGTQTPVLHPIYKNSLVGDVIIRLDHTMKSILAGGYFPNSEKYRKWVREAHHKSTYTQDELVKEYAFVPVEQLKTEEALELQRGHTFFENKMQRTSEYEAARVHGFVKTIEHFQDQHVNLVQADTDFIIQSEAHLTSAFKTHLAQLKRQRGIPNSLNQYLNLTSDVRSATIYQQLKKALPKEIAILESMAFFSTYLYSLKKAGRFPTLDWRASDEIIQTVNRIPLDPSPMKESKSVQHYNLSGGCALKQDNVQSKPTKQLSAFATKNRERMGKSGFQRIKTGIFSSDKKAFLIKHGKFSEDKAEFDQMISYMTRMKRFDHLKWSKLHIACFKGNLTEVFSLLDLKPDEYSIHDVTAEGVTPLYLAAKNGNAPLVKMLLERGTLINAALPNGDTPLLVAVRHGHFNVVKMLGLEVRGFQQQEEFIRLTNNIDTVSSQIDLINSRITTREQLLNSFEEMKKIYDGLAGLIQNLLQLKTRLSVFYKNSKGLAQQFECLNDLLVTAQNRFNSIGIDYSNIEKSRSQWEEHLIVFQLLLQHVIFDPNQLHKALSRINPNIGEILLMGDGGCGALLGVALFYSRIKAAERRVYQQQGALDPDAVIKYRDKISALVNKYFFGKAHDMRKVFINSTAAAIICCVPLAAYGFINTEYDSIEEAFLYLPFSLLCYLVALGLWIHHLIYQANAKKMNPNGHMVNIPEMKKILANTENMVRFLVKKEAVMPYDEAVKNLIEALVGHPLNIIKTHIARIKSYISSRVDYNVRLRNDATVLYEACAGKHPDVLEYLLTHPMIDIDPNLTKVTYTIDDKSYTLIELAILSGQTQLIQVLWKFGSELSVQEQQRLVLLALHTSGGQTLETILELGVLLREVYAYQFMQNLYFSRSSDKDEKILYFYCTHYILDLVTLDQERDKLSAMLVGVLKNSNAHLSELNSNPELAKKFSAFIEEAKMLGRLALIQQNINPQTATPHDVLFAYYQKETSARVLWQLALLGFPGNPLRSEFRPETECPEGTSESEWLTTWFGALKENPENIIMKAVEENNIRILPRLLARVEPNRQFSEAFLKGLSSLLQHNTPTAECLYYWARHAVYTGFLPPKMMLDVLSYQIHHGLRSLNIHQKYNGYTVLHYAISEDKGALVEYLIREGVDISILTSPDNLSALHLAYNRPGLILMLLQTCQLNPDLLDRFGMTAFHAAIRNNQMETVKQLINITTKFDTVDETGKTIFHYLLAQGHHPESEIMQTLKLKVSADFFESAMPKPIQSIREKFHHGIVDALEKGKDGFQPLESLLQLSGAEIVKQDYFKENIKRLVGFFRNSPSVKSLARKVAGILYEEWLFHSGYQLLGTSEKNKRKPFLQEVSSGLNEKKVNAYFITIENRFVRRKKFIDVINKQGKVGDQNCSLINVRKRDSHILFKAAETPKSQIFNPYSIFAFYGKSTLKKNINNIAKKDGSTPIHALTKQQSSCDFLQWQLLKDFGYDLNQKNSEGKTPLHIALTQSFVNPDTISGLIAAGAKMNIQDNDGVTAEQLIDEKHLDALRVRGEMNRLCSY